MTAEAAPIGDLTAEGQPGFDYTRLIRALGYVLVALAILSAGATFFTLTGLTTVAPTPDVVFTAMLVNGALVGALLLIVLWEIVSLIVASRKGRAAARLHIRIVGVFSLVAAAPAVILALAASFSLDRGLDNWFSTRTRAIVDTSLSIAQAYAEQQALLLRADLLAAKAVVETSPVTSEGDQSRIRELLATISSARNLPGLFLVGPDGALIAQSSPTGSDAFPPPVEAAIDQARVAPNEVALIAPSGNSHIIGGVTALAGFQNAYLYAARPLDQRVNRYLAMTNDSVAEYRLLEATRLGMQVAFGILFIGITIVVILSAIWLGIGFANRLVNPIRRLIDAAKEVSEGNLNVSVKPRSSDGDVGALGTTFNTMTSQLRGQREQLIAASEINDSRRRFIEAVLSGVSAGVIGIDADGRVTIVNRTAVQMLGNTGEVVDANILELVPELEKVVTASYRDNRPEHREQITLVRSGRERTMNVRVTTERSSSGASGYVITLDDITDLVTAQRSSAWADIARRIAHEIKNPLTPIQLSAERLRRKFGKVITEDREVFDQCTDTIVRQVGDIGRMVDEFSSFARMPKPTFVAGNLSDSIREAMFLISVSQPDIAFDRDLPKEPLEVSFDSRLMGQALANVIKNATEAIHALPPENADKGKILVKAKAEGSFIVVDVIDNGIGLPRENRHRLLEPYVTTREKGTGLGLAIVTKIIEEHGGRVELLDAPAVAEGGRGAMIRITLTRLDATSKAGDATEDPGTNGTGVGALVEQEVVG
jgi:two-component system, NtrC family, nitrogen regulation sensor histidine kinase NtrY